MCIWKEGWESSEGGGVIFTAVDFRASWSFDAAGSLLWTYGSIPCGPLWNRFD